MSISLRFASAARLTRNCSIQLLKERSVDSRIPVVLPAQYFHPELPATSKWFKNPEGGQYQMLDDDYFEGKDDFAVMVEYHAGEQTRFERAEIPMYVFRKLNSSTSIHQGKNPKFYIAQNRLESLHPALQSDVPTPNVIRQLGRGDIYDTSVWMGMSPTSTPLHRDPNPNYFVQLAGPKRFRLISPDLGNHIVTSIKRKLATEADAEGSCMASNFMTEDMMTGPYREAIDSVIWDAPLDKCTTEGESHGLEARLDPGDSLFIPLGWWHAVRGEGEGINASVSLSPSRIMRS